MRIGLQLDDRETQDRRELFQQNVNTGHWFACVCSADLRYFVPIVRTSGRFCTSLPIEFKRLGIKQRMKKFFPATRTEAEKMILRAAAIRGEDPPLLTIFGPRPRKARSSVEKDPSKFPAPQAVEIDLPGDFKPRQTARLEAPFVWAAEAAFRRIQESDVKSKGTAMLTYLGHLRISNEVRSPSYRTHIIHLEKRAGLKESAIRRATRELHRIGLLFTHHGLLDGTAGRDINAYTLGTTYQRGAGSASSESEVSDSPDQIAGVPGTKADTAPKCTRVNNESLNTTNRLLAPLAAVSTRRERELMSALKQILSTAEMKSNGGLWRLRIRHNARAVSYAIEDWRARTPDQRRSINNVAAWLTDRHARALVEIDSAPDSKSRA